jgi:hypothetical protein
MSETPALPEPRKHRPIHAGDPPEVFAEEAKLLAWYGEHIGSSAKKLIAQCSGPAEQRAAAEGYLSEVGSNIPDSTIRAAVRRLAALKFRKLGVDVAHSVAGNMRMQPSWAH